LLSWIVNVNGVDIFLIYLISIIQLIIDGIDTSTTTIMSMSMTQPITSMAPSVGDDDTIDDASMADP
jgi:hypothetical protein